MGLWWWWLTVLAAVVITVKWQVDTDDYLDTKTIKDIINSAESFRDSIISIPPISRALKSLIVHVYKSDDVLANVGDWAHEMMSDLSRTPVEYMEHMFIWVDNMEASSLWPNIVQFVAKNTQLSIPQIHNIFKNVDHEFQSIVGCNLTVAAQLTFAAAVKWQLLNWRLLRFAFRWTTHLIGLIFQWIRDLIVEEMVDTEELLQTLISYEFLEGVSVWFRFFRDTYLMRKHLFNSQFQYENHNNFLVNSIRQIIEWTRNFERFMVQFDLPAIDKHTKDEL